MSEELKPVRCGCGGSPIIRNDRGKAVYVQCVSCGTRSIETNYKEAVAAWNRAMGERTAKVTDTWKVAGFNELNAWCPECEHRIKEDCVYCPTCGVRLEWE